MSKEYSLGGDGLAVTTGSAFTLLMLNPPGTPAPEFLFYRFWISQQASTTSAQARVEVVVQASAWPTVVSATPQQLKRGDQVASLVAGVAGQCIVAKCGINASAEGGGSRTVLWGDNFNVLNGWLWSPTPREVVSIPPGTSPIALYIPTALTTTGNWAVGANYAEGM